MNKTIQDLEHELLDLYRKNEEMQVELKALYSKEKQLRGIIEGKDRAIKAHLEDADYYRRMIEKLENITK